MKLKKTPPYMNIKNIRPRNCFAWGKLVRLQSRLANKREKSVKLVTIGE